MSRLSVFWPDECDATSAVAEYPMILPFPRRATTGGSGKRMDVITRARILFENRCCRQCHYPVVEPMELDDGLVNSTGLEIPGTATLVGFQCQACDATWSI